MRASRYSVAYDDGNYDYRLHGYENQALEVTLPPGGVIQTERGAMAWRHQQVRMNTGLGQGMGLLGALRRRWSGDSLLVNTYTNYADRHTVVGITPHVPSHIMGLPRARLGPDLTLKKGSYLASNPGMDVTIAVNQRLSVAMFSKNFHLVMQRIRGDGTVFITSNGVMLEKRLGDGESLLVEVGHLIAFEAPVTYELARNHGVKNILAGGEGVFMMRVRGPGRIWVQTTPRGNAAQAMLDALRHG